MIFGVTLSDRRTLYPWFMTVLTFGDCPSVLNHHFIDFFSSPVFSSVRGNPRIDSETTTTENHSLSVSKSNQISYHCKNTRFFRFIRLNEPIFKRSLSDVYTHSVCLLVTRLTITTLSPFRSRILPPTLPKAGV